MKSKTLALATLLFVMAFLLVPVITSNTALARPSWADTGGGVSSHSISSLACDSVHNLLYAGCYDPSDPPAGRPTETGKGVWKYDGTSWTDSGGGVSSYYIESLACDSGHNLLYASCYDPSTNTGKGVWKYEGH